MICIVVLNDLQGIDVFLGETWAPREAWGSRSEGKSALQSPKILSRQPSFKSKGTVTDLLKLLPKLVGLNSDLMSGNALLAVNGTVLQAPRLGVNGYRANGIHNSLVAKAALMSTGHSHPLVSFSLSRQTYYTKVVGASFVVQWVEPRREVSIFCISAYSSRHGLLEVHSPLHHRAKSAILNVS